MPKAKHLKLYTNEDIEAGPPAMSLRRVIVQTRSHSHGVGIAQKKSDCVVGYLADPQKSVEYLRVDKFPSPLGRISYSAGTTRKQIAGTSNSQR